MYSELERKFLIFGFVITITFFAIHIVLPQSINFGIPSIAMSYIFKSSPSFYEFNNSNILETQTKISKNLNNNLPMVSYYFDLDTNKSSLENANSTSKPTNPDNNSTSKDSIYEWLENPLILLIVGGIITSIAGPYITNNFQNHQKKLEISISLFKQLTKTQTIVNRALLESIFGFGTIITQFNVKTKGGLYIQKEELEEKFSNLISTGSDTNTVNSKAIEVYNIIKNIETIESHLEQINQIAAKTTNDITNWAISYREITSDFRTYYKNKSVKEKIRQYNSAITNLAKLIVSYGKYARDFTINESQYTNTIEEIEKIRTSKETNLLFISDKQTQELIDVVRKEMRSWPRKLISKLIFGIINIIRK